MALTYPLALADFFEKLPLQSCTPLKLSSSATSNRTAGGDVLTAGAGTRLWQGRCEIARRYHRDADAILALISVVEDEGASFMMTHPALAGPNHDPTGAILGASIPTILSLNGNNVDMRLAGLPAGYRMRAGEMFSFRYGENPTRHALHRIVSPEIVADGSGQTPVFQVTPHIRPGATSGLGVSLFKPAFKAVIVPGSVSAGTSVGVFTTGISFEFTQTLR